MTLGNDLVSMQIKNQPSALHAFRHVSCAQDPLDLRPAADAIVAEAKRRRERFGPVMVVMSERHTRSTHIALRQLVLQRLLRSASPSATGGAARVAYGIEQPHNFVAWAAKTFFSDVAAADRFQALTTGDPAGTRLLQMMRVRGVSCAPIANDHLWSFCQRRAVSTRGLDAATDRSEEWFDLTDPVTLAQRKYSTYTPRLLEPDGLAWRNRVMVTQALAHQHDLGADFYVIGTGLNHVLGNRYEDKQGVDSLTGRFQAAGSNVLPILITDSEVNLGCVPDDARSALAQTLIIDDVSAASFLFDDKDDEENAFLDQINTHSGSELEMGSYEKAYRGSRAWEAVEAALPGWAANGAAAQVIPKAFKSFSKGKELGLQL